MDGFLLVPFLCFDQLWASGRREEKVCKPGGTPPCPRQPAEQTSEEALRKVPKVAWAEIHGDLC